MMFVFNQGHSEINGRQEGKYKCLQEADKQFDAADEEGKGYRGHGSSQPGTRRCGAGHEDEAEEDQQYNVACQDIGKESHHQDERLQEDADKFKQ